MRGSVLRFFLLAAVYHHCEYLHPYFREDLPMAAKDFKSVEEYIAGQPEGSQPALERVRRAILRAVPAAEERISYKMPTYTLEGKRLLYFASWKAHYALYGASKSLVAAFGEELARYEIAKGTIRFPLSEAVPVRLIERIAIFRADEATGHRGTKKTVPKGDRVEGLDRALREGGD
jgi:uncharacterized protein YdhG (YjbR/CyaY superfamily)